MTNALETIKGTVLTVPKRQFLAICGGDKKAETKFIQETSFALSQVADSYQLQKCTPKSIEDSIVSVALTGLSLNPELRLGYLIPYGDKCSFRSSYMGKRDIILRTGMVKSIIVNLVYENDQFESEYSEEHSSFIHKPEMFKERGEIVGGYWKAKLSNDEVMFGLVRRDEIEHIRDEYSEGHKYAKNKNKKSVWDTEFPDMCKKTILNKAFKELPKTGISEDVLRALEADSQLDRESFEDAQKRKQQQEASSFDDDAPVEQEIPRQQIPEQTPTQQAQQDAANAEIVEEKKEEAPKGTIPPNTLFDESAGGNGGNGGNNHYDKEQ